MGSQPWKQTVLAEVVVAQKLPGAHSCEAGVDQPKLTSQAPPVGALPPSTQIPMGLPELSEASWQVPRWAPPLSFPPAQAPHAELQKFG